MSSKGKIHNTSVKLEIVGYHIYPKRHMCVLNRCCHLMLPLSVTGLCLCNNSPNDYNTPGCLTLRGTYLSGMRTQPTVCSELHLSYFIVFCSQFQYLKNRNTVICDKNKIKFGHAITWLGK